MQPGRGWGKHLVMFKAVESHMEVEGMYTTVQIALESFMVLISSFPALHGTFTVAFTVVDSPERLTRGSSREEKVTSWFTPPITLVARSSWPPWGCCYAFIRFAEIGVPKKMNRCALCSLFWLPTVDVAERLTPVMEARLLEPQELEADAGFGR